LLCACFFNVLFSLVLSSSFSLSLSFAVNKRASKGRDLEDGNSQISFFVADDEKGRRSIIRRRSSARALTLESAVDDAI
jgi:hypothetical protein